MKLSNQAVDQILHVIATFDRERGVPHDYFDLETVLRKTAFTVGPEGDLVIELAKAPGGQPSPPRPLEDSFEAKELFLEAAREWRD